MSFAEVWTLQECGGSGGSFIVDDGAWRLGQVDFHIAIAHIKAVEHIGAVADGSGFPGSRVGGRHSRTAASGKPTITLRGFSAPRALTSTSTSRASTPRRVAENKRVIM